MRNNPWYGICTVFVVHPVGCHGGGGGGFVCVSGMLCGGVDGGYGVFVAVVCVSVSGIGGVVGVVV